MPRWGLPGRSRPRRRCYRTKTGASRYWRSCRPITAASRLNAAMKLLVMGGNGQLGSELRRLTWPAGTAIASFDRGELDIASREPVVATVARERPDIVINAAANTAVDRAEVEPELAWASNCAGPANLAAAC